MIEHPNYATILFNTLSNNIHIRLPHGEWARVFSNGGIKVSAVDNYSLDVNSLRAVLCQPPCDVGKDKKMGNFTSVRLWHEGSGKPAQDSLEKKTPGSQPFNISAEPEGEEEPAKRKSSLRMQGISKTLMIPVINPDENNRVTRGGRPSLVMDPKSTHSLKNIVKEGEHIISAHSLVGTKVSTFGISEQNMSAEQRVPDEAKLGEAKKSIDIAAMEFEEFLSFNDDFSLCRSLDSWDNRFALDIYGESVVNKSENLINRMSISNKELVRTLSDYCKVPESYVSGILRTTSSEEVFTIAKKIHAARQPAMLCNHLPDTKIFIMKRDMSGHQFLQKAEVDRIVYSAKACKDAIVIEDPIPNLDNRKYVTVMKPVGDAENPSGIWTGAYREPVFRPRYLPNKEVKIVKPVNLRWFGYILEKAHTQRPKYCPTPKSLFLKKKNDALISSEEKSPKLPEPPEVLENEAEPLDLAGDKDMTGDELSEIDPDPKTDRSKKNYACNLFILWMENRGMQSYLNSRVI